MHDWTGGIYTSPGISGSRSGAFIAGAWAALLMQGKRESIAKTKLIVDAGRKFNEDLAKVPDVYPVQNDQINVVAFRSDKYNPHCIKDLLDHEGWNLSAIQLPNAVHVAITLNNYKKLPKLVEDIKKVLAKLKADPSLNKSDTAAFYAMPSMIPDPNMIKEFLNMFVDGMLAINFDDVKVAHGLK